VPIQCCKVMGRGSGMFALHLSEIRIAVHVNARTLFAQRAQGHWNFKSRASSQHETGGFETDDVEPIIPSAAGK
jgi:hypothetical protein